MRKLTVGLLLDSLSNNTGDKAIRTVMEDFLRSRSIQYKVVNPTAVKARNYSRFVVGGGDLIQPLGNSFYDAFRQKGNHVLNCVGLNTQADLDYLKDYAYVSVRSEGDAEILRLYGIQPSIVPCVSMLLRKEPVTLKIPPNTIGFHFHSVSYANVPDVHHVIKRLPNYSTAFIPFTHYYNDAATMELVANRVPGSLFLGKYEPEELISIIGKLRAFVCSSLHAAIFAYMNNVPFLVFPYSPKVQRFLKDRNLERFTFHNSTDLEQKLADILSNPPDFTELFRSDVGKIRNHLDCIAEVLRRPLWHTRYRGGVGEKADAASPSSYLSHMVEQKAADLHYLETKFAEFADENWKLKQTRALRMSNRLGGLVNRLVPPKSRTKDLKDIAIASATVLRVQGFSSLARKSVEKIRKREFQIITEIDCAVPDREYAEWILRNEPKPEDLAEQRTQSMKFAYQPLISIIVPVWNPPRDVLSETIQSVMEQTYPNWEMCITDGGSIDDVKKVLLDAQRRDRRVRVRLLDKNLGISGNSNISLEMCRGEFAVLLDHDDQLAAPALFEVVNALNKKPNLDFIYTDKDRSTLQGKRLSPLFKPDWSPEVMLSANYVTHMCAIRTELLRRIGGFRPETDGAQDWDLFLRVAEVTNEIHHIPKVLYHWRLAPDSVSVRRPRR